MEWLNAWIDSLFVVDWERLPVAIIAMLMGLVGLGFGFFMARRQKSKDNWLDKKFDGHE